MHLLSEAEFWVAVAFVIFIGVLVRLGAHRVIVGALDDRAARIKAELDEALKLRQEAEGVLAEYRRKQGEAEKVAEAIILNARGEAESMAADAKARVEEFIARRTKVAETKIAPSDDAYEILLDGQPTGVIELPIERIVDDFPYFGSAANGGLPSPDAVEAVFRSEFEMAHQEGGLFILTMHPHITGHRSRIAALEKLILYMKSKPGVWFATHEQIARYVKTASATSSVEPARR